METNRGFWGNVRDHMDTMRSLYVAHDRQRQEGNGYIHVPTWARALMVYVGGPLFAVEQYWLCWLCCERGWPDWPGLVASRMLARLSEALERRGVAMRWNAPDSGLPGEVGFWSPSDGTHERSAMRIWIHPTGATTR